MNEGAMSVAELRKQFPFPWSHQTFGNGLTQVVDSTGKEIPMLTMLGFLVAITTILNQSQEK